MRKDAYRVLFLCTGNSARSIIAECLLNRRGHGRFLAYSAGSAPKGDVHPDARALLAREGFDTGALRSKSWNEFARAGAPKLDFVVTVCDNAAGEPCPAWPGGPVTGHWSIPDPVAVPGAAARRRAFTETLRALEERVAALVSLPLDVLDPATLSQRLNAIGRGQAT